MISNLINLLAIAFVIAFVVTQIAGLDTTIWLHRSATHKSLILHPIIEWLSKSILWITTGLLTREWVAVHRKHHAFTDEEGDPHSPLLMGFWSVQLGNVFHYIHEVKEMKKTGEIEQYSLGIKEDWWDKHVFNHGLFGLTLGTTILCLVFGLRLGLLAAGIHAVLYVGVLSSSINGLCHWVGYRNFDNTATNIRLLALVTCGEALHNNHHGHPRSPKFSYKAWEFDPAWPIIRLLIALNLATAYKTIDEIAT
jgi:stearoyl-CoA desaturase (Delta-9 desaturase)